MKLFGRTLAAAGLAAAVILAVGNATTAGVPVGSFQADRASAAATPAPLNPVLGRPADIPEAQRALGRDALYQHVLALGIPADAAAALLGRIDDEALRGNIPVDEIGEVAALASDFEVQQKSLDLLTAYAEWVTFGQPLTEDFSPQGIDPISALQPAKIVPDDVLVIPGTEPTEPVVPKVGGTCQTCPAFDFGPFTPIAAYTTHTSSLTGGTDCAWYQFNVVAGNRYEFTLCNAPGAATWDSVLELYQPVFPAGPCGSFIARNDDCSSAPIIRQSTLFWDATFSGPVHLKLKPFSSGTVPGIYTLAYRNLGVQCQTCANPGPALAAPAAVDQSVSGNTDTYCTSRYYTVNLVAGESYRFTTCPGKCAVAAANYDTFLRLWNPACAPVATNDDDVAPNCSGTGNSTKSTLDYTATTTGSHVIQVTGRTNTSGVTSTGTYTMCYRRTSAACATCATGPYMAPPLTPTPTCQDQAGSVNACQDSWYQFNLTGGKEYEFTTCSISGACTTGTATFDTILEFRNSGCVLLASDDDGCGVAGRSKLTYTVPAAAGGVYRLLVKGKAGATGSYTLTYREVTQTCTAPSGLVIGPTGGDTGILNCARPEVFNVSVASTTTLPVTYSWNITSTTGGLATPPNDIVSSSAPNGATSFNTTLTNEGSFTVTVTASNACGSTTSSITYVLLDIVKPTVTAPLSTTAECSAVPAPGTPTVRDNCDPSPAVVMTETTTPGSCPGEYVIRREWVATDRSGNVSNPAIQVVTVRDRTPPTITPGLDVAYCVYPPNHDVACFDTTMFSPVVTDNCSLPVTWFFSGVISSEQGLEPCGDGNAEPDIYVSPDGQAFCVRADRCGNDPADNDGRRYLVTARAADACGNTTGPIPIGFVLIPHDASDTSGCIEPTSIPIPM